jgi:hypothetical protein
MGMNRTGIIVAGCALVWLFYSSEGQKFLQDVSDNVGVTSYCDEAAAAFRDRSVPKDRLDGLLIECGKLVDRRGNKLTSREYEDFCGIAKPFKAESEKENPSLLKIVSDKNYDNIVSTSAFQRAYFVRVNSYLPIKMGLGCGHIWAESDKPAFTDATAQATPFPLTPGERIEEIPQARWITPHVPLPRPRPKI